MFSESESMLVDFDWMGQLFADMDFYSDDVYSLDIDYSITSRNARSVYGHAKQAIGFTLTLSMLRLHSPKV